eukprot:SAG25_NODE_999_length_4354_cov_5.464160_3_plen_147_part_00
MADGAWVVWCRMHRPLPRRAGRARATVDCLDDRLCVLRGRALCGGWGVALTVRVGHGTYSQDAALSDFERAEAWLPAPADGVTGGDYEAITPPSAGNDGGRRVDLMPRPRTTLRPPHSGLGGVEAVEMAVVCTLDTPVVMRLAQRA